MFDQIIFDNLLATRQMGKHLVWLDEIDSTNKWIAGRLGEPDVEKMVVIAKKQKAGRGRFGRQWCHIPGKSLAFSLAWPIAKSLRPVGVITLAAGVALGEAIMEVAGTGFDLKYPNDLLFNGLKAGGILSELKSCGDRSFVVIGVGANINNVASDFPDEIKDIATSVMEACGKEISMAAILAIFLNRLEAHLDTIGQGGSASLIKRYKELCSTLGKTIRVVGAGDEVTGVAVDVDEAGELIVEVGPGDFAKVNSGETWHIE